VFEVIAAVEAVSGRKVPFTRGARRAGDPAVLVAAADRIRAAGWSPRFSDLTAMVRTAYEWRLAHPRGYDDRDLPGAPLSVLIQPGIV
jgi:UDP-glucose 4-epimerase